MTRIIASLVFSTLICSPASAERYTNIYTQPLEGVYWQGWYTVHLREVATNIHEIYVRGDGKLGDFFGVLWLDCVEARFSNWLSEGGYLNANDVPAEAIKLIRQRYC